MPMALTVDERVRRARMLIDECRSMPEPSGGHSHGRWIVKMRSRLIRAERLLKPPARLLQATADDHRKIDLLLQEIDGLYPSVRS